MRISREKLQTEATTTRFRPGILEKAIHLLGLLNGFRSHPFLRDRFAIKGGTALNMFLFDLPRLSVDIDLNYVGAVERDAMLADRPKIEQAVQAVCAREGFAITRMPMDHAGGKWRLRYDSALGGSGNLDVDLNFMYRVPLWPTVPSDSRRVGSFEARQIPLLDVHELAAGKLAALLSRHACRDLFDAHLLLTRGGLDRERLRLAFTVYGGMNRKDWRTVSIEEVGFVLRELKVELIPTVRTDYLASLGDAGSWARTLGAECRAGLTQVLPFTDAESEFLNRLLDFGEIAPSCLTRDPDIAARIASQPWLHWKAMNVRKHKGLT